MNLLSGTRVIDVTRLLPGGYCSMLLSEFGAEVIKVEEPEIGDYMRLTPPTSDGASLVHSMVNKNKMSLGLNLKSADGKKILGKLVSRADVFIEGFRPGVIERLGFSFESVRALNPRIVYCSISAFGHTSPLSQMPGHDLNFQGMAGLLDPEDEALPLVQYADLCSGIHATLGILAALCSRRRRATYIDVAIVQSLLSWLILPASHYFTAGSSPRAEPSLAFGSEAFYNLYKTLDGKLMAVAAIEGEFWDNLLSRLGLPGLGNLRRGSEEERSRLREKVAEVFSRRTREEWASILMNGDTCASPVLSLEESLDSDWARSALTKDRRGRRLLKTPLRFRPPLHVKEMEAPTLGQHSRVILKRIGFSEKQIDSFDSKKVVS